MVSVALQDHTAPGSNHTRQCWCSFNETPYKWLLGTGLNDILCCSRRASHHIEIPKAQWGQGNCKNAIYTILEAHFFAASHYCISVCLLYSVHITVLVCCSQRLGPWARVNCFPFCLSWGHHQRVTLGLMGDDKVSMVSSAIAMLSATWHWIFFSLLHWASTEYRLAVPAVSVKSQYWGFRIWLPVTWKRCSQICQNARFRVQNLP